MMMQHPRVYIWCVLGKCERNATCKHQLETMKGLSVLKAVTLVYALLQSLGRCYICVTSLHPWKGCDVLSKF